MEDALRRHRAREQLQTIMNEKANLEANQAFINSKSDKVLYDRFCSDFERVCQSMSLDNSEETTSIVC